jgi:hypothetical protein
MHVLGLKLGEVGHANYPLRLRMPAGIGPCSLYGADAELDHPTRCGTGIGPLPAYQVSGATITGLWVGNGLPPSGSGVTMI